MLKKLAYCPYGNCRALIENNTVSLISYSTGVIQLVTDDNGYVWLGCTGTYSRTTIKHIAAFLREYAPAATYYTAKAAYLGHYLLCLDTGEIREY